MGMVWVHFDEQPKHVAALMPIDIDEQSRHVVALMLVADIDEQSKHVAALMLVVDIDEQKHVVVLAGADPICLMQSQDICQYFLGWKLH
jgi:hypothetical protein